MVNAVTLATIKITENSNCPFSVLNCKTGKTSLRNSGLATPLPDNLGKGMRSTRYQKAHAS
jgi:hypothetical protein